MGAPLIFLLTLITTLILVAGNLLYKKNIFDVEKLSPFECGFSTKFNALPFSLRFFIVCLIFLIFDVELVLLFPFLVSIKNGIRFYAVVGLFLFTLLLIIGLYHE